MIREMPDGSPLFVARTEFDEQTGMLQLDLGANPLTGDDWLMTFSSLDELAYDGLSQPIAALLAPLFANNVARLIIVGSNKANRQSRILVELHVYASFGRLMYTLGFKEPIADQFAEEVASRTQLGIPADQARDDATQAVLRLITTACNKHLP